MATAEPWLTCRRTATALGELEAVLRRAMEGEGAEPRLAELAGHLIARGGKRLRPALTLLAGALGKAPRGALLRAAAALELVHVASLYHDDVVDRAPTRRGAASANAELGNATATVLGTFLFARACALVATLGDAANLMASAAFSQVCAGQIQEVENAYNLDLSEEEHLEILARKTGALFELPCRLGAHLARVSEETAAALALYARHLGLAFQLADDALDLAGQASELGKATGTDLREGVYSLAVLRTLHAGGGAGAQLRELLLQVAWSEVERSAALALITGSGAIEEAMATARDHARRAQDALRELPDGAPRRSLLHLAEYAVERAG